MQTEHVSDSVQATSEIECSALCGGKARQVNYKASVVLCMRSLRESDAIFLRADIPTAYRSVDMKKNRGGGLGSGCVG